jgi:hypothetical protein
MNDAIRTFLDRLDEELLPFATKGERLNLYLLGRAALVLYYQFTLSTTDVDIVWLRDSELEGKAIELMGEGSTLANALGLYLHPVPQGLPSLPQGFRQHCELVDGGWKALRLWKLEIHDLAATKLKSFRPKDREDLQILCDRGLLNATKLRQALEDAFPYRSPKPEDAEDDPDTPDWGKALANCKRVESYLKGAIRSL